MFQGQTQNLGNETQYSLWVSSKLHLTIILLLTLTVLNIAIVVFHQFQTSEPPYFQYSEVASQ